MADPKLELSDAQSVDEAAEALFGSPLGELPAVSQSTAVWAVPDSQVLSTIRLDEHAPKSDLDFLALHIARARADAIVITGKILRDEPELRYDLCADPRWGNALVQWRKTRWDMDEDPWLLVLTSGRALSFEHPVFRSGVRPLIFSDDRGASRYLSDSPYPVIADRSPCLRSAIKHLQQAHECRCVSIEAGPSTSRSLFDAPLALDELLLSVYESPELDPRSQGDPFISLNVLQTLMPQVSMSRHQDASGQWAFRRLRRGHVPVC